MTATASNQTTLLDIAKMNGSDAVVGLIDETTKAHPELRLGAARTITGLSYKTLVRIGLFNGSTFRDVNEGVVVGKSAYVNREVPTFVMEPRFQADKAAADKHEDGASAYLALEGQGVMEKSMADLSANFYYGRNTAVGGNAKGFPGLIDAYDATNNVVDAGGTSAGTGSSAWLIKYGPRDVQWLWGAYGQLALSPVRIQDLYDASGNAYTGYVSSLLAYPGLQVGSVRSVVRIKNLTADSGKGLTDGLIAQALAKFEAGIVPDVILMNRRSRLQLQLSRSVTIFSGAGGTPNGAVGNTAPMPVEGMGIPIEVTDAISSTEPLTL